MRVWTGRIIRPGRRAKRTVKVRKIGKNAEAANDDEPAQILSVAQPDLYCLPIRRLLLRRSIERFLSSHLQHSRRTSESDPFRKSRSHG